MAEKIDVINEFYMPVLEALDIYADDSGKLFRRYCGKEFKVHISGKEVVLPTPERLRNLNAETTVPFHPLSESISRGDSSVQNLLKQCVTLRMTFTTIMVMQTLLEIALNKDWHDKLKSDQLDILSILPDINSKTVSNFSTAMQKVDLETTNIIKVYNRRNGEIAGRKYNRVAVITFPLFSELLKPKDSAVWGVREIRKRDIADYQALLKYVLPDWDVAGTYSAGSDSLEAPSFIALLQAYSNITSRLNSIIEKFSDFFEDKDLVKDLTFTKALADLSRYRGIIPPLEGNIGSVVAGGESGTSVDVRRPKSVAPVDLSNLGNNVGNVPVSNEKAVAQEQPVANAPVAAPAQPQYQPVGLQQPVQQQYQPQLPYQPQWGQPPQQPPSNNPIDSWNQNTTAQPQYQPQYVQQPQYPQQGGWGQPQPYQQPQAYGGWGQQPMQNQNGYVPQSNPYMNQPPAISSAGLPPQQYQPQPQYPQQGGWGQQPYQPQQGFSGFKTR